MAAGDISYDSGMPLRSGNSFIMHGSIEVDDATRGFAITDTKSRLISCQLADEDGSGSARCNINVNSAGTATNGSVQVWGGHQSVETYRFRAEYR